MWFETSRNERSLIRILPPPCEIKQKILTKDAVCRPSPICDAPLSEKPPPFPSRQTHTQSILVSSFAKRCWLMPSCPQLDSTLFQVFPLVPCTLKCLFLFASTYSQFKERQWKYSSERRECGRLGYVSNLRVHLFSCVWTAWCPNISVVLHWNQLLFLPDDMEDDSVLSGGKVRWRLSPNATKWKGFMLHE